MSVEKSLYQVPTGIEALAEEPAIEVEIEIEQPEGEGMEGTKDDAASPAFAANLADTLDAQFLNKLGGDLIAEIQNDLMARRDWEKMYAEGINLLGLKIEERTEPWNGACGVFHPMVTEAVVRFQSETVMETFPASGPVKTQIVGKITKEKEDAARRVKDDMNWQVTTNMTEFRLEHEKLCWDLPGAGSAFKKVYYDPTLGRQTSRYISAEDVIIPYGGMMEERTTHRMRKTKNEVEALVVKGFWRDLDNMPEPQQATAQTQVQAKKDKETGTRPVIDNRYVIYEVHTLQKLEGLPDSDDGLAKPYVITVLDTGQVLAVYRNWKESDENARPRDHFVHYQYIPGYGAYGYGLFHLIGGYAKSATSILRQLVDAGTLSNLPGGLKSRGLRIKGDDTPIAPGEWRDVDIPSGAIKDNIVPLPYKEPSAVLSGLLGNIVDEARRVAATADLKLTDMSAQTPVGTMFAMLERSLKVMTAVQARVHAALKKELQLIAALIRDYTDDDYDYDVEAPEGRRAKKTDYEYVEIIPVSDPNAATMAQRVVQYQAAINLAATAPQIYDMPMLHRQMLEVLGIKNAAKLVPTRDDMKPIDPVQENQNALSLRPLKAFAYQDHEAHIRVHMAALQDPLIAQMIGQNPKVNEIMQSLTAHIAEHTGYAYRNKISQAMGLEIPVVATDEGYDPLREMEISRLMAQAAPMVLAQSQQMVAQRQAQQNMQDPVMQIEMKNLQLKEAELERKKQKDLIDAAAKADQLRLKEKEIDVNAEARGVELGERIKAREGSEEREGVRLGMELGRAQMDSVVNKGA